MVETELNYSENCKWSQNLHHPGIRENSEPGERSKGGKSLEIDKFNLNLYFKRDRDKEVLRNLKLCLLPLMVVYSLRDDEERPTSITSIESSRVLNFLFPKVMYFCKMIIEDK